MNEGQELHKVISPKMNGQRVSLGNCMSCIDEICLRTFAKLIDTVVLLNLAETLVI